MHKWKVQLAAIINENNVEKRRQKFVIIGRKNRNKTINISSSIIRLIDCFWIKLIVLHCPESTGSWKKSKAFVEGSNFMKNYFGTKNHKHRSQSYEERMKSM